MKRNFTIKQYITVFGMLFLLLGISIQSNAEIIYVDGSASGNADGTSWTDAYHLVQDALDHATSGDEIWIARGTYKPSTEIGGTGNRYQAFQMVEGVEIYGGFNGTETSVSQRANYGYGEAYETILSGNIGSPSSTNDNCYHVFHNPDGTGLTSAAVLDGVTISGGHANENGGFQTKGGGMYNDNCSPQLNNVTFTENYGVVGGAFFDDESSSEIKNSLFISNEAGDGGAFACFDSNSKINNSKIISNSATDDGGAIRTYSGTLTITNTTISSNEAVNLGGAVLSIWGNCILNNCIIWGNTTSGNGNEFAFEFSGGEITLNHSCYSNGTGDVYVNGGTFTATNNNTTSNPKFVDAPNGDYTLYGSSPCVNTGENSYNSESEDLRGRTRVQNSTIDMGCYEWTDSVDPDLKVIYVDDDASGDDDGQSWTDAFTSFQDALDDATSGDEIWVAAGTYKPTSPWDETVDGDRDFHFRMVEGVEIYGGFTGTESAVSERTSFGHGETNETILSGDIGTQGDNSDNCYHVFYHPEGLGLTSAAILDGFTITGGNANYTTGSLSYEHYNGGGIYNDHNSPSLTNVTIVSNTTAGRAGGIHNYHSSPTITNSKIISNTADNWAGGMYNGYSSSPSIVNTLIASNTGLGGGGIFNRSESHPVLTNTTIVDNLSTNEGGGIENHEVETAYTTLNNCIIWGNTAYNDGDQICTSNDVTMNNCCYANQSGDITGTPTVSNCTTNNPKFVDAPNDDYTLYGNSPCVNTGEDSYNSETYDLRGEDRVQNFNIDMGCYEYTSGTDPENCTIYVDANSGNDSNNGFSWGNAKQTLQAGLDLAYDGDQVWVASGTYTPSSAYDLAETGDRDYHFRMIEGVAIYGGFAGTESAVSERTGFGPGGTNETTLSGDIGTGGDDSDNCYHVFYHPDGLGLTSAAVLDGFTITGGNADGSAPHSSGGGIYNDNNSPTLENLNLTSNSALGGGGIYISNSSPTITNVYLTSNSAMSGGGMRNYQSSPVITNALIASNTVTHDGAGVYNNRSAPTLTNVTIAGNTAADEGGGLYNYVDGLPVLNNCIVWGNSATYGKQFYIHTATVTLDYCCYSNGTGDVNDNGGNGTLTATNSITNNPKFNDAAGGDYTLYGTSPCVDSGSDAHNSETTDLRGQARKQSTIDMGAYEWTSGTDPDFAIIYADADRADDSGDGLSWATAKQTLQAALDMAVDGEQVWVAAGTYTPTTKKADGGGSRYKTFQMIEGVGIYGGFDGTETEVGQRDNYGEGEANETILSGDIGTVGSNSDNCYHVFNHPDGLGLTSSAILDGFTITNGNANVWNYVYDELGGGMCNRNNSPTIQNVVFKNNRANGGGGMYNTESSPTLTNVTFKNNTALQLDGGAMIIDEGSPVITNCSFTSNTSSNYHGGALCIEGGSTATFTNVTLTGNDADRQGGAIRITGGSSPVFTNAIICDNTAGEMGGGIIISGSPVFNNVTISNNSTTGTSFDHGGGGIYIGSDSDADFNNCIIYGNQAANSRGHQIRLNGYSDAKATLNYSCYSNGSNDTYDDWYLTTTNNNITSNPLFIDAGSGDYRVYGNSPCVNDGNNGYNSETTDIRGQARKQGTIDMGAYEWTDGLDPYYTVATWTGNTSTVWNLAGNWDIAEVPGATNDVVVPDVSNDPIVSSAVSCNNLTIESGGVVTINHDGTLSVDGTLTNNGGNNGLVLQSTVSGTGKLKNNTAGVSAKVQQYLVANQWHYMGIPFTGSHNADAAFPGLWAMSNDETSASNGSESGWAYLDDLDQVSAGNGYAIYHDLDTNFMMQGTLVTGETAVNTSFTNEGWNFIANPYPCTVDWGIVNSNLANVNNAIYVWDPTLNSGDGNYATYIDGSGTNGQTQYIAPMQGFFVKGNTGAGSVSFTNDAKTAAASNFKSETLQSIIRLAAYDSEERTDETVIRFKMNATNGFDGQMDAYKLKANSLTPQFYSVYNSNEYSINSIPQANEDLIIPLELMVKTNGEHTIALSELSNYNYPYPLILKNPATGESVNLQNEDYCFKASEGETLSLQLGFSNSTVSADEWIENNIYLWSENQSIAISRMDNVASEVAVLNASGQVVYRGNVQTNELWIPVSVTGMYIVRVKPENGAVYNGKVVVR